MKTDIAFGFVFGLAVAAVGFPFTTWQYWLLVLLACAWRFLGAYANEAAE